MFKKSTGGSAVEWATLVWAKKDSSIPTPNFEFYNAETRSHNYMVMPGERGTPQIDGVISKVDIDYRAGFNDRKNNTGEKNEMRLRIFMSPNGIDPARSALTMPLISDIGVPNYNSLSFLATVNSLLNQGFRDCPVRLGFFQRQSKKDGKFYPASSIVLGSRNEQNEFIVNEEGEFVFDNYKNNMIRTDEEGMRPNPSPIMQNGTQLVINGQKAYDHSEAIQWVNTVLPQIMSHYEEGQAEGQAEDQYEDDGVDPGAAFDQQQYEQEQPSHQRQRM